MSAALSKKEGSVTLKIFIEELSDGAIELDRMRISTQTSSRLTKYPPSSYAPMTASEKIQELVNLAIAEGYKVDSNNVDLDMDSYSFLFEIDASESDRLDQVIQAFGHSIHVDEMNNVTTIVGTEFVIGSIAKQIRMTGLLNVARNPEGDAALLHHLAVSRAISYDTKVYTGNGVEIDILAKLTRAHRDGKLDVQVAERLYEYGILRRPMDLTSSTHAESSYGMDF